MSAAYLRLDGFDELVEPLITEQIETNLLSFYNWGMLNVGGFYNITRPTSGTYGGDKSKLRPVNDPRYQAGRVWETFQPDIVWESGVEWSIQPIAISGIWINGSYYPPNSSTRSHKFDYQNGRVIFTSGIPTTSTVTAEYSYRWVRFVSANSQEYREVQNYVNRVDDPQFLSSSSGNWNTLRENRVSLPMVGVYVTPRFNLRPLQLGGGQILKQDVEYYIVAETAQQRDKIADIIKYQNDKQIRLYDVELTPPTLNFDGTLASGVKTYPDLVRGQPSGYWYKDAVMHDTIGMESFRLSKNIYSATVRTSLDVNMEEL